MSFWKKLFRAIRSIPATREQSASFYAAAREGDLEKIKGCLKNDPDLVFSKVFGTTHSYDGGTALHGAVAMGHKRVVELLLASKAEVNAKNNDGFTPLHYAAYKGHKDVVKLLLASKAEVNAKSNEGYTPLHYAAASGHKDVVQLLRGDSEANLEHWKASEEPATWVRAHLNGWNHQDWLNLLASLRQSQYWPMEEAAVGQHLELLRRGLTIAAATNLGYCDQCGTEMSLDRRYAFYSDVKMISVGSTGPTMDLLPPVGNMMICEACVQRIVSRESFAASGTGPITVNSDNVNSITNAIKKLNAESIVGRCKRFGLSPEEAKEEG